MKTAVDDWAKTLVRVRPNTLKRGDTVYQRHVYGKGQDDVRWHKGKVQSTAGRASVSVLFESGREAMLHCVDLWQEPASPKPAPVVARARVRAAPPPPSEPPPAAEPAQTRAKRVDEDEFTAWLAMGRDMLSGLDQQRTALDRELVELSAQLDAIDGSSRRQIERIEAELLEAKHAWQNERAFVAARQELVSAKLAGLNERRHAMASLMGEG